MADTDAKTKSAQKKSALVVIASGFGMQVFGFVANGLLESRALAHSFALFISFGGALLLAGCIFLARAKGRSWAAGLLGLLSVIGVAILWFLPDRWQ